MVPIQNYPGAEASKRGFHWPKLRQFEHKINSNSKGTGAVGYP